MALRKSTKYLVVHVTATQTTQDLGVTEVRKMHLAQGWSDIGYHYVIRRSGTVQAGRPEADIGSHVKGFNSVSLGVSLVGGIDAKGKPQNNATPAQLKSLEKLLRELSGRYPQAKICGHRDLSPDRDQDGIIEAAEHIKACPCFDAIPWAESVGLPAAAIRGEWTDALRPGQPKGPDERVVWLQTLLARRGFVFGPIDGIIGDKTRKAIEQFQIWAALPRSKDFDLKTVKALRALFETTEAA